MIIIQCFLHRTQVYFYFITVNLKIIHKNIQNSVSIYTILVNKVTIYTEKKMKLEVDLKESQIDQKYIDKIEEGSCVKEVRLADGLKGIYDTLSYWGKVINPKTMTLVAEVSTPLIFNEEHDQSYLPRFKQDYFTIAGYELAE